MTRGLYPIRPLARLISSPLPFSTPLHIFRLVVSCRVRLAARITHVVHPDRTVEFNVVDLDLLADGVYLEDVHSTNGEWGEVEAPAPKHLGAEVENVHGVNAGHGGYIWQTLDEFLFGIGRAEFGIGQPVNALRAVCVIICKNVVGESYLVVHGEARRAELDVVMDELVGLVVGDTLGRGFASGFEAALGFHRVGKGHAGHGRRDDEGEETHD